ncbi:MAG: hypothetical protein E7580_08530 [Ruminococcaceae bacterium]|nr:hypothetical protein [Oscillospiraceae bacterium]
MDREQDLIRELASMDDEALREGLGRVAESMGIAPGLAARYLSDMGKIRETVLGLTPEDLGKIRDHLGEENMNQILNEIRRDG